MKNWHQFGGVQGANLRTFGAKNGRPDAALASIGSCRRVHSNPCGECVANWFSKCPILGIDVFLIVPDRLSHSPSQQQYFLVCERSLAGQSLADLPQNLLPRIYAADHRWLFRLGGCCDRNVHEARETCFLFLHHFCSALE
ncbi:unnamed protein product [Acanthoscelides obtectus]|uniref:Uncharacterized protein n=1 Tax=Acanthoscelides obtectus TaxID=200917 RepID=A0A9P0M4P9_ACAOB|nr:unnamed protein product [Acanthoscelides obtectus]CAK1619865.1 hypothetical protein AOBTE_LOCUS41 [Acanthoscelides obtectus]